MSVTIGMKGSAGPLSESNAQLRRPGSSTLPVFATRGCVL